jgi:hypothetical protein
VGEASLGHGLATACRLEALRADGWRDRVSSRRADCLVVAWGAQLGVEWGGETARLLDECARLGVPSLLWAVGGRLDPHCLDLVARFDGVFADDRRQLAALEDAGARAPTSLPAATALAVDDAPVHGTGARPHPVVWAGGWSTGWPASWRDRTEEVLRAATGHGLTIFLSTGSDALPEDLAPHVARATNAPEKSLRQARVVLALGDPGQSPWAAQAAALDAVACGAAAVCSEPSVIAATGLWFVPPPDRPAAADMRRDLVPVATDGASMDAALRSLLEDDESREAKVGHARRVVAYNHTYANRVATLVSAVGTRVVPARRPARRAPPPRIHHVVGTRFSVRMGLEPPAFERSWLEERLRLLELFCLPSVMAQTTSAFTLMLLCDEATPPDILDALRQHERESPAVAIALTGSDRTPADVIAASTPPGTDVLVTTRLDSDDAIADGYLEAVQEYAAPFHRSDVATLLVNFPRGMRLDVPEDAFYERRMPNSPFHSLFERPASGPARTIFSGVGRAARNRARGNHATLHEHQVTHQDESIVAWLQVVHGGNLENRITPSDRPVRPEKALASFSLGEHDSRSGGA